MVHESPSSPIEELSDQLPVIISERLGHILWVVPNDPVPQIPILPIVICIALQLGWIKVDPLFVVHEGNKPGYAFAVVVDAIGRLTSKPANKFVC